MDKIIPITIEDEMRQAYLDYAMSVIVSRALPDVRDGLKPVHRRILFSMHDTGVSPDKPTRKCAKIVGDVIGRFHPHGDVSVYDALVRMAQTFSLRYPLITSQGNFGSVDGDPPAAMRYTESKLARIATELLADIEKDTITWRPTYDNSETEPEVLPAGIPNLLVNGSSGIAVGMATNIPPHNLNEIVDACVALIDNPELPVESLLGIVRAPDFPTAGLIMGLDGVRQAYLTGRGSVTMRARTTIEEIRKDRYAVVATELPYQVNKARLIEKIAELVKEKRITGVSDVRDESDKQGLRVVVELQASARPQVVLNQLFKHTDLQSNFGVNMLALVDNQPRTLSLRECLDHYLHHRRDVIERRTRFLLKKAEDRAHIVEGQLKALDRLDEVIATIRAAANADEARANLMERIGLTEPQATSILDMRLQKLTGMERQKLLDEFEDLKREIARLLDILSSEANIYAVVREGLLEVKKKYGDERRTEIITEGFGTFVLEDLIPETDVVVTVSKAGYIKRLPTSTYKSQHRGGKGVMGVALREEDFLEHVFVTTTHNHLLFFTNHARVYRLKVYEIAEAGRQAKGTAIVNLLNLNPDEHITAVIPVRDFGVRPDGVSDEEETEEAEDIAEQVEDIAEQVEVEEPEVEAAEATEEEAETEEAPPTAEPEEIDTEERFLVLVTARGLVKKTPLYEYGNIRTSGLNALKLREGDTLVGAQVSKGTGDMMLLSRNGMAVRFPEKNVPAKGRVTQGVKGMKLREEDHVVAFEHVTQGDTVQIVTIRGYGKRIGLAEFRRTRRGGYGVKAIGLKPDDQVVAAGVIKDTDQVIFSTSKGVMIRLNATEISEYGRSARGVTLIRVEEDDAVTAMAILQAEDAEPVEEDEPLA
ncbi:MAG TPA: DNA gyrase subunit A [Candidatus Xenobia bacterium]